MWFTFLLNLYFQLTSQLDAKLFLKDMIILFNIRAVNQHTGFFWSIIKIFVQIKLSRKSGLGSIPQMVQLEIRKKQTEHCIKMHWTVRNIKLTCGCFNKWQFLHSKKSGGRKLPVLI